VSTSRQGGRNALGKQSKEPTGTAADLDDRVRRLLRQAATTAARLSADLPHGSAVQLRARRIRLLLAALDEELQHTARAKACAPRNQRTLPSALHGFADRLEEDTGLAVVVDADPGLPRLPQACEQFLYSVVVEAAREAWARARCSVMTVRLVRRSGGVRLTVIDDGVGLALRDGGSLAGLLSRLGAEVSGRMSAVDVAPCGVRIDVSIPQP
jgi:signal transduction histidine kinase